MIVLKFIILVVVCYLLGSVNMAFFIGKLTKNIDLRTKGSGNLGSTNVLRVLGKRAAIITLVFDILKGVIAVWLGDMLFGGGLDTAGKMAGGLAVILGHNFPFYLHFKGGKGIATSCGIAFYLNPWAALVLLVVEFGIIFITKYVSLASIINCVLYPFVVNFVRGEPCFDPYIWVLTVVLGAIAFFRHWSNLKRLIQGNENKTNFSKH